MIKGILLVLAMTVVGILIGFAVGAGLWELSNPHHAPENFGGGVVGFLAGAPLGGLTGVIFGTVLAIRWFRKPSNKA